MPEELRALFREVQGYAIKNSCRTGQMKAGGGGVDLQVGCQLGRGAERRRGSGEGGRVERERRRRQGRGGEAITPLPLTCWLLPPRSLQAMREAYLRTSARVDSVPSIPCQANDETILVPLPGRRGVRGYKVRGGELGTR